MSAVSRPGVTVGADLTHHTDGVRADATLGYARPGVHADATLACARPGVRADATLERTDALARVRLQDTTPEPRITLKEKAPEATFFKWVEDVNGTVYFVTIDDEHNKPVGWNKQNTEIAQKIDRCVHNLLQSGRTSTRNSDVTRYKEANSICFTKDEDGTSYAEADMPRRDERSFILKLGGTAYENLLGTRFGPIRVGLKFGGTFRFSSTVAQNTETSFDELREALKKDQLFQTEKIINERRRLDVMLKKQREQLTGVNTAVETPTKMKTLEALVQMHKAEDEVVLHPAVRIVDGDINGLDLSQLQQKKDVLIPVTIVSNDGTKHAVSFYYDHKTPKLYFYDSLGKTAQESGAQAVVDAIIPPTQEGWQRFNPLHRLYRPQLHKGFAPKHQPRESKDCAKYSILFFERMVAARMKKEDLQDAYANFTEAPHTPEMVRSSMEKLLPDFEHTLHRGRRWHPDQMPTDADGKPVPAEGPHRHME